MFSERPSWNIDTPIGGSKGALGTRPSLGPISLIFMQFRGKIGHIYGWHHPLSREILDLSQNCRTSRTCGKCSDIKGTRPPKVVTVKKRCYCILVSGQGHRLFFSSSTFVSFRRDQIAGDIFAIFASHLSWPVDINYILKLSKFTDYMSLQNVLIQCEVSQIWDSLGNKLSI